MPLQYWAIPKLSGRGKTTSFTTISLTFNCFMFLIGDLLGVGIPRRLNLTLLLHPLPLLHHEFHEIYHSVTFYFMKKDSKRCCDTTTPEFCVCFHLWREWTSTMNVTEWQVQYYACCICGRKFSEREYASRACWRRRTMGDGWQRRKCRLAIYEKFNYIKTSQKRFQNLFFLFNTQVKLGDIGESCFNCKLFWKLLIANNCKPYSIWSGDQFVLQVLGKLFNTNEYEKELGSNTYMRIWWWNIIFSKSDSHRNFEMKEPGCTEVPGCKLA